MHTNPPLIIGDAATCGFFQSSARKKAAAAIAAIWS